MTQLKYRITCNYLPERFGSLDFDGDGNGLGNGFPYYYSLILDGGDQVGHGVSSPFGLLGEGYGFLAYTWWDNGDEEYGRT